MAHRPFASAPYIVGSSAPAPAEAHIPAEESLCPVVSHDWVNAEYKHLMGPAADSSLVRQRGDRDQFLIGVAATYRFGFTIP